tara:strand:+ start:3 stop:1877 length:1875 start_codon:yes stop_codon:yes gene_type:complete
MRSQLLIVAFAVGTVTRVFKTLNDAFADYEKLNFKINAIIKSTGMTAGFTAKELDNMANSMEKNSEVTSTAVKEMQARLLTFTNIVGTVFKEAQESAADMAAVFGQDLSQATIQLGKALNDPVKGYTALRRIGVSFSAQQVKLIKNFQEQGDIMGAQKVILEELQREFGGAAEAQTKAAMGAESFRKLMAELGEATRDVGEILQPVIFLLGEFARGVLDAAAFIPELILNLKEGTTNLIGFTFGMKRFEEVAKVGERTGKQFQLMNESLSELKGSFRETADTSKVFSENVTDIQRLTNEITDLTEEQGRSAKNQDTINEKNKEFAEKVQRNIQIIANLKVKQDAYNEAIKKSELGLKIQSELLSERLAKGKDLTTAESLKIKLQRELTESEKEYADSIDLSNSKLKDREAINQKSIEFASDLASSFLDSSNQQMQAVKNQQKFELEQLRNSRRYQRASDKQKQALEKEITDRNQKDIEKAFNRNKNARYAQTIIDTYSGITRAYSDHEFPASAIISSMIGAMGFANANAIRAQQAPKFATGGLVGGRRHSQGGTMIEAEQGEYVISRSGVDSIGIEALNRINAGGGGGVSISINNPILSKDVVEDDLIPQIKEAIRRGADIGVS